MKKFGLAILALVTLLAISIPQAQAYENCVSVTSSAGGTVVVPAGISKGAMWLTLTGSSPVYCRLDNVPTSTAFDIYLTTTGSQWYSPQSSTDGPTRLPQSVSVPNLITCLSSSGSQTVCYNK